MVKIIGEIGINHNGSVALCKKLMLISKGAGLDYVKIQKRNPDVCVPEAQKVKRKVTPWGEMSYLEYKYRIEFNEEQIVELLEYVKYDDREGNYLGLGTIGPLVAEYVKSIKNHTSVLSFNTSL